jgi:hypothetical protein
MQEAELWAKARRIEEAHGELAPAWIAAQIVESMRSGDREGGARMRRIATLLMQLQHGHTEGEIPQRHATKLY